MREHSGDIHFVCVEVQALAKKHFNFNVVTTQIGHRQGLATIAFILGI